MSLEKKNRNITKYNLREMYVLKDKRNGKILTFDHNTTFLSYDADKYSKIGQDELFIK